MKMLKHGRLKALAPGFGRMNRNHWESPIALCLMAASVFVSVNAQEAGKSEKKSGTATKVINLWPGVAPGSEQWKQPETALGSQGMEQVVNVTTPTLTAYLPQPPAAVGTAVIIAPGGGFIGLSINSEGHDVAKWLAARGITAFVLKYRLKQIGGQDATPLGQSARAAFMAQMQDHALIAEDGKYGVADGIQAIKVVRAHATEWGVSPDRIVFMGFSAGGMITELTAVQSEVSARPTMRLRSTARLFLTCLRYQKNCRPSSWRWRKTTTSRVHTSSASTRRSRPPDIVRNFTSIITAVTAGACASKAQPAITGSTNFIIGWKRKV